MSRTTSRYVLAVIALVSPLVIALAEQLFQADFIVKTILFTCLYFLPAFVLSKLNPHILCNDLFALPNTKKLVIAIVSGIAMVILTWQFCPMLANFVDLMPFAHRLQATMGKYTDMQMGVVMFLAIADSCMNESFFRGIAFFNLSHLADKTFAHFYTAGCYALFQAVRLFGLFSLPVLAIIVAASFGISLLFSFMYLRTKTIYSSFAIHLGFNVGVYLTALSLLSI